MVRTLLLVVLYPYSLPHFRVVCRLQLESPLEIKYSFVSIGVGGKSDAGHGVERSHRELLQVFGMPAFPALPNHEGR
jgi:hypothetical protein